MSDNRKKILEMLTEKKISADDALRLLDAIDAGEGGKTGAGREDSSGPGAAARSKHKYLRVTVTPGESHTDPEHADRVNVRIPMSLIRAGIKLGSLIPPEALDKANSALREKGINFDVRNIKPEDIEDLIDALGDMQVDVDSARGDKVKVFVE
jgi:hypothetical protein